MKEGTMKRLLKMLWSKYKIHLIIVFLCIVGNALFNVQGTMFMQTLIDDHIVPLLKSSSPDFSGLFHALIRVVHYMPVVLFVPLHLTVLWFM